MSAFSAGAIVGTLGLDVSEYAEAMRESTMLAGNFAEEIGHILAEATGSAVLGELANGISETVAAIASNNIWETAAASIHLAGDATSGFIELIKGQAEEMHAAGLAAEKYGVSIEWMSSIGKVAKDSGADIDTLGLSLKMLLDRAANAVDGNKEAIKAFHELGIAGDQLTGLMENPEELFMRVADGLNSIDDPGRRVQAIQDAIGRSGAMMLPLLEKGSVKIKELAREVTEMGGAFTKQDEEMGDSFSELGMLFDAGVEGIKKSAAQPILQYMEDHADALKEHMKSLVEYMQQEVPAAMADFGKELQVMAPDLEQVGHGMGYIAEELAKMAGWAVHAYSAMKQLADEAAQDAGNWWGRITSGGPDSHHHLNNEMPDSFPYDPNPAPSRPGGATLTPYAKNRWDQIHPVPIVVNNHLTVSPERLAEAAAAATSKSLKRSLTVQKKDMETWLYLKNQMSN